MNKISHLVDEFKQQHYVFLSCEFSGGGDSGQISALWLEYEKEGEDFSLDCNHSPWLIHIEFLEMFFYQYINQQNYYDDEGGQGKAFLNLETLELEIEWTLYFTSSYNESLRVELEEVILNQPEA